MPSNSPALDALAVKNQFLIEAYKRAQHKKFAPYLKRIDKEVNAAILAAGESIDTKKQRNSLISTVRSIQYSIYAEYIEFLDAELAGVGVQQSLFEANSYEKVVVGFESKIPTEDQIVVAYNSNPLQVEDMTTSPMFAAYKNDMTKKEVMRVSKAISDGFTFGSTNQQIVRAIRGTKANNYNDGLLSKSNRAINTMVRTSVQHVATQARMRTMKDNDDLVKGWTLVVTYDSRTTTLCYDLGQKEEVYPIGKGPIPPLHYGCRDTISPKLSSKFDFLEKGATRASSGANGGEQVSAKLGSYDWMLTQPVKFQEASMGVKRSALLRDGGLTPTEYAKLSTNNRNHTLTLKEMYKAMPSVFDNAGVKP